jgi:hemerythrin superfamily protein
MKAIGTETDRDDIVEVLVHQHQRIRQLLGQVSNLVGLEKADAFLTLCVYLERHEDAERKVVHPVTRHSTRAGEWTADGRLAEEEAADAALERLRRMGIDDPAFRQEFRQFADGVLAHDDAEENGEFRLLRSSVPMATRRQMAVDFVDVQAAAAVVNAP